MTGAPSIGSGTSGLSCDTHVHFYDGRHPASVDAVLHPPDASVNQYLAVAELLSVDRVVVVQPTTYGLDNSCQLNAMAVLADRARGVMVVDDTVADEELRRLTDLGVRGARFHMLPGGAVPWQMLNAVAARIARFGWHVQLQLNGRELPDRLPQLMALPTEVVVDHVGRFMPPVPIEDASFAALLTLVEEGKAWVKLSAPYESSGQPITNCADDHADVEPLIAALVSRVPDRLLWATNWPHPGQNPAPSPATLAAQIERWLPTPTLREQVLVTNPDGLYFR